MKEVAKKIYRKYISNSGVYNIYINNKNKSKYSALLIYTTTAIREYYKKSNVDQSKILSHSGFQESIELVKCLNTNLFKVDCINYDEMYYLDMNKYDLVIDTADNLKFITNNSCVKINYATSCHWLYYLENSLKRIKSLREREGLSQLIDRPIIQSTNEIAADYITIFGNSHQKSTFNQADSKFIDLNISVSYSCDTLNYSKRNKNKFIWYGGYGAIHKGLDLVIAAFEGSNDKELIVIGNVETNAELINWFNAKLESNQNIKYYGWMQPNDPKFISIVKDCVAQIFPSSSEGGAGSVIQLMHFGIMPIVTESCCLRAPEEICYLIKSEDPLKIISGIKEQIAFVSDLSDQEIQIRSNRVFEYATRNYSLKNYRDSLDDFINIIKQKL